MSFLGGGLYLRSLAGAVMRRTRRDRGSPSSARTWGPEMAFVPPAHCRTVYLRKNKVRDILARTRLYPTYLITYLSRLVRHAREADIVLFHNSRCGLLMDIIRRRVPGKTYAILSDNVEGELQRQHIGGNVLRQVSQAVGFVAHSPLAEGACRSADFMTFITEADRTLFANHFGHPARTGVLPISLLQATRRPGGIGGRAADPVHCPLRFRAEPDGAASFCRRRGALPRDRRSACHVRGRRGRAAEMRRPIRS